MENKVKILLPNERVAFVYCRIYYELDLPNSRAIVLLRLVRYCYSPVVIRDGPLEKLLGEGGKRSTKKIFAHGKIK